MSTTVTTSSSSPETKVPPLPTNLSSDAGLVLYQSRILKKITLKEARALVQHVYQLYRHLKSEFVLIAGYLSREEYLELLDENLKIERIGGTCFIHSPASTSHESLVSFMLIILEMFAQAKGIGVALGSRLAFDVKPAQKNRQEDPDTVEPDVCFLTPEDYEEFLTLPGILPRLPPFIIEVLSPGTKDYDLTTKRDLYLRAGVTECWFIDEDEAQVIACRRTATGFRCRTIHGGRLNSTAVSGFWIDVDWLWQQKTSEHLQRVLSTLLNDPNDWQVLLTNLDVSKIPAIYGKSIVKPLLEHLGRDAVSLVLDHFGESVLPVVLDHFGESILPTIIRHYGVETLKRWISRLEQETDEDSP